MVTGARRRRVGLAFWDGYVGISPSLLSGIDALVDAGFGVDLVVRDRGVEYAEPGSVDWAGVRVHRLGRLPCAPAPRPADLGARGPGRFVRGMARRVAEHLDRMRFARLCRRVSREAPVDAWIGVDAGGMLGAGAASGGRTPLIHWSLELEPSAGEHDPLRRLALRAARRYQREAELTLVQDRVRADALHELVGGGGGGTIHCVPNAPAGPVIRSRSTCFHDLFDLPEGQRVVLHAGAIHPESRAHELVRAARDWPEDWTLVLHERVRRTLDDPYLREIAESGGERVRLSLRPVPYSDLDRIFSAADVSLAFYSERHGNNVRLIGAASGKVAWSLRAGVPVVVSDSPGLAELVRETGCGEIVREPGEAEAAIRRILDDHEAYRSRAYACYRDRLEFGRAFGAVVDDLDLLIPSEGAER